MKTWLAILFIFSSAELFASGVMIRPTVIDFCTAKPDSPSCQAKDDNGEKKIKDEEENEKIELDLEEDLDEIDETPKSKPRTKKRLRRKNPCQVEPASDRCSRWKNYIRRKKRKILNKKKPKTSKKAM